MNIDTNTAAAILGSSEMGNNLSIQNRKSSQNSASFQEQLKSATKDDTSDVKNAEETSDVKNEASAKADNSDKSEKSEKKENPKSVKDKPEQEVQKSEQNQQASQSVQMNGGVEVSINQDLDGFSMLSDQVKTFMLQNGGQYNLNMVNLMSATTRQEISDVKPAVDYTSIQMSDNDAMFFANLVKNTDMSMQSVASEFQKTLEAGQVQQAQSSAKASAALIAALQESSKTNQPFRIDFDKDISVIIKVDKDGNINANFIPGDKAVEAYLRNNIEFLRQRFNEENIAYGDLNYSKSRQGKEEKEQRNNKKEQENE